jgi:lipoprotein-releasing system permease protein
VTASNGFISRSVARILASISLRFTGFVAWRYIRAREMKVSLVASIVAVVGLVVYAVSRAMEYAMFSNFDWLHRSGLGDGAKDAIAMPLLAVAAAIAVRVTSSKPKRSTLTAAIIVYGILMAVLVFAFADHFGRGTAVPRFGVAHPPNIVMRFAQYWFVAVGPAVLLGIATVFRWRMKFAWVRVSSKTLTAFCVIAAVVLFIARSQWMPDLQSNLVDDANVAKYWASVVGNTELGALALAAVALYFGILRLFLSFFTTVSVGGVWIGTGALVIVLSVMGGFEADLREKILGSNAHIQVTKEDGDFLEWRQVRAKINGIDGVKASTPFAVSEVVLASNDNGMNVIIKGIDPVSVASVTDLVDDLEGTNVEDQEAMRRLLPLVSDDGKLDVPQTPTPKPGAVIDKAPDDMPQGADPVDLSSPKKTLPLDAAGSAGSAWSAHADNFGGDAVALLDDGQPVAATTPKTDPAPDDLTTSDDQPQDFSAPAKPVSADPLLPPLDAAADHAGDIHTIEIPLEDGPHLSRRTQSLPGIFVGRELVKQTHLYVGKEVRIVSPLSDPSNPDATGTPIPFNRDYRVAGVFFTGMYEYDLKYVYVTLDSFQEFLDRGESIDGIEVRIGDPDDTTEYVQRISQTLGPEYRVVDWKELNRSLFSALKLEKIAMFIVLGIVILVASFSIVGNLIMVVVEKGREIALLKTLGATDRSVQLLFVIQGLFIGTIGTMLGVGMGLGACWYATSAGAPLNAEVYYIDKVPIHVDPWSVAFIAVAGIAISIAATLYPAYLAAKVRPAYGLKHI